MNLADYMRSGLLFLVLIAESLVEACFATSPGTGPVASSTAQPLRTCSPTTLTYGTANGQSVAVTPTNLVSTPIAGTSDSISTMQIGCSASPGNNVAMHIDQFDPLENQASPQPASVTVNAECSSVDMQWYYVTVFQGQTIRRLMTTITCLQAPNVPVDPVRTCSPTALVYGVGDNQLNLAVMYTDYLATPIIGTSDTTSTMKVRCSAIADYHAIMTINDYTPTENDVVPPPQTVTINAECSSVDMVWYYVTTIGGQTISRSMNSITCTQAENPCLPTSITYGVGDNQIPEIMIDVGYSDYATTLVAGSTDTTSTMKISCSAIAGYITNMDVNNGLGPAENDVVPPPQTVAINAECSSVDSIWNYVTVVAGQTVKVPMTSATCQQIKDPSGPVTRSCSPTALTYGMGDGMNPEVQIGVTYTDFMTTATPGTMDSVSTMKITCSGIAGYNVQMELDGNTTPLENAGNPPPQTVTINAVCNSADMIWKYVSNVGGVPTSLDITTVTCAQIPNRVERQCSPTAVTLGIGDGLTPQRFIDVTYSDFASTPITGSLETTSTMKITCTAMPGYNVLMQLNSNPNSTPVENMGGLPQSVTITLTCNSADMIWNYVVEFMGAPFPRAITSMACVQQSN